MHQFSSVTTIRVDVVRRRMSVTTLSVPASHGVNISGESDLLGLHTWTMTNAPKEDSRVHNISVLKGWITRMQLKRLLPDIFSVDFVGVPTESFSLSSKLQKNLRCKARSRGDITGIFYAELRSSLDYRIIKTSWTYWMILEGYIL